MEKITLNDITIELTRGDIASQQDIEAIVNAANAQLRTGGGVAGAIHRAAGPGLEKEARDLAPIEPGEAVLTGGHNLPNAYVIHCLGPVYGRDKPEAELLADCYRNALRRADEQGIASVAFPAISCGAFGYPVREAAEVAFKTIGDCSTEPGSVQQIRFVLFGEQDYRIHREVLSELYT